VTGKRHHFRIIVCVKHITGFAGGAEYGESESYLRQTPNPLDLNALEEGLRLSAAAQGEVVAVSVGGGEAEVTLKHALRMGADRAVRIWEDGLTQAGPYGLALVLSRAAQHIGFDLILCGARSADSNSEVTGALIAERLELPLIAGALGLRCDLPAARVRADKKLERGERETYAAALPAVVTIESGIEPRYYGPRWVHRLLRGNVEFLRLSDIGLDIPPSIERLDLLGITPPRPRAKVGIKVGGLSLKEKLAVMRGQANRSTRQESVGEKPEDAARKIIGHLEKWLG
jgi:electron transfer flavoprotein beta subunit